MGLEKLILVILNERFGQNVEKVAECLLTWGSVPLSLIRQKTGIKLSKVKESLVILIKYRLVEFSPSKNENIANYQLLNNNVLLMLRYPRYISLIKKKFGGTCEIIIEELLLRGYLTATDVLIRVYKNQLKADTNVSLVNIKNDFIAMINAKYITQVPKNMEPDKPVPRFQKSSEQQHILPPIDINLIQRFMNDEKVDFPDNYIYWHVNFDRFHQDIRDKAIVNAVTRKFDENAGELIKIMLQQMYIRTDPWVKVSNPIPILEIKDIIRKQKNGQLYALFDQYITVIEQDSCNLLRKVGEASGGSYELNFLEIYTKFTWEILEQCVLEKFGSKAARIFRLIKEQRYIDPDSLEKEAMLPAKEARILTYKMMDDCLIKIREIRKANDNGGPGKCFNLWYIDMPIVVRNIIFLCYQILFNVMTRRHHEMEVNKRLIDKKQRVEAIALTMKAQGAGEEQLADIEDMISPTERESLKISEAKLKKLNTVELEVEETLFLLDLYLKHSIM